MSHIAQRLDGVAYVSIFVRNTVCIIILLSCSVTENQHY